MKKSLMPMLVLIILGIIGCSERDQNGPIPAGVYYSEAGDEWIFVDSATVQFRVKTLSEDGGEMITSGKYEYVLGYAGEIIMPLLTGDVIYLDLISRTFHWSNGKIERINRHTGEADRFAMSR